MKWTGTSTLVVTAMKYVRTIILARLLVPDDFGLMAMVTVIVGLGQAFSDMGISLSIIWKQDASDDELSSIYWFNLLTGVAVSGLVVAVAPLVVRFYNEPRLYDLVLWVSPIFLITSIGLPFQMILQKELMFRHIAILEIISALAAAAVSVAAAFLEAGVYALIWGAIVEIIMRAILQTAIGWKTWHPYLHFGAKELRSYLRFGIFNMFDRLLNFYQSNIDYIILGRFLGGEMLGIYMIAYQMVIEPLVKLNPILTRVAFPVFARKQDDNSALRRGYCEMSKMVGFMTFPVLALMAATVPLFIPALFGAKWAPAITLIQILAILGVLKALINPLGSILYTKGRTDIGFYWNLLCACLNTAVFWTFVRHGVYVIAWLESALTFLYFILVILILKRLISLSIKEYATAIASPLMANLFMGVTVYAGSLLLKNVITNQLALLIILVTFGLSLYAVYIAAFERRLVKEYWGLLWRK